MTGLLLINLGTPTQPTTPEVRRYLREFLSDPEVIDISPVGRAMLLNLVILPFRPARSAAAYQKIWTDRGSPLLFHSLDLVDKVRARVADDGWRVELGMRYGAPSIEQGLRALIDAGADRIVAFPLYPQYAASSTLTSRRRVEELTAAIEGAPPVSFAPPFYDDPGFLDAFTAVGRPALDGAKPDYVLFSFHGLPERHIRKTDPTGEH